MKVLQINATYGIGSTGTVVADIGKMLNSQGHETYFAYQRQQNVPKQNSFCVGNEMDWKCHALLSRITGKQSYFSTRATKKLIKWIDYISPDVVHLHNLHSNYINIKVLFKYFAKANIPVVLTMHDCWFFTGKCFHYIDVGCNRFENECGHCPKKKYDPDSWFFDKSKLLLKNKNKWFNAIKNITFVGCSKWICSEAKKSIIQNHDIVQIYNGVDTSVFKVLPAEQLKVRLGVQAKRVVLGMANKWLLPENEALLKSLSEKNNNQTAFVIVGCSDKEQQKLKQYGSSFIPVGFIKDKHQLAEYYNLADVFVNLTHADTLPTVNMESICCGTPVITFDESGSPELVLDGCGQIVQKGDVNGMLEAIFHYAPANRQEVSQIGLKNFSKNSCYNSYLNCYQKILTRSKK